VRTDRSPGRLAAGAVVAAALALAACSSNSSTVVHTATAPVSSVPANSSAPPPSRAAHPSAKVTPATGLTDRQQVQVDGAGFTPGEALTVLECAQKGDSTGPGDCNLTGMTPVTADGLGNVSLQLTVLRGPFGANKIVCSAKQPCLVSVTQASLKPTEEADAAITFAPA
jgi:heat shock protein HslJ